MLPHGAEELSALAAACSTTGKTKSVNGWAVDLWILDAPDVDAAVAVYDAVLAGGATDEVVALLEEAGLDLLALLNDEERTREEITRSDLCEYIGAATLISLDGWTPDHLFMPNIPKMSRRKSDSGIDVFAVSLEALDGGEDLTPEERLSLASVKHTVDNATLGMRGKLVASLGPKELSRPYLIAQLRVLNGQLQREGFTADQAARVYLFARDFPDGDTADLIAIGVADAALRSDFAHQVSLLPEVTDNVHYFRMVLVPDLADVHDRCA